MWTSRRPAASAQAAYISNAGSTMTVRRRVASVARGCLRGDVQALVEAVGELHPSGRNAESRLGSAVIGP